MKRKIKITSKMIKKTVLWAILVVLVVGLGIVVVQSFGNDHILSNNTQLQDVDYSDEYRLYLEKQLVTKSSEAEYEDIISDRIVIEREKTEIAQAKKLEDLKAEYEQKKVDVQKQLEKDIEEYTKEAEEDKAKVDADNKNIVLAGAEIQILDANKNVIDTLTTDENGQVKLGNLKVGKYYYKENKLSF